MPLLIYANSRETNPRALFFFLLFVLPVATTPISGVGLINYSIELSHIRILEMLILLLICPDPARDTLAFRQMGADIVLAVSMVLTTVLYLRDASITATFR